MRNLNPQTPEEIRALYGCRYNLVLKSLAQNLVEILEGYLVGQPRIDRVSARPKSIDRFVNKALKIIDGKRKYNDPLSEIQDQVGARIIVFYLDDVDRVDAIVKKYFTAIEYRKVIPESETEFSYFGQHLVLKIPSDVIDIDMDASHVPEFFELQIKTLFQHAWSEANHDLGYKEGDIPLTPDQKRRIAFTSAQAWGADHMFKQLFCERNSAQDDA